MLPLRKRLNRALQRLRYGSREAAKARKYAHKDVERRRRFASERWSQGDLAQRRYESYQAYLDHQAEKLDRKYDSRLEKDRRVALDDFRERFRGCEALRQAQTVLCVGARLGTEVEALHELGHFAVGIDLNPGPASQYVLHGDLHQLVFPDACVDAVYTNVLDHVYDLGQAIGEIVRVLRPGGVLVADILPGFEEGFTPGEYEATFWRTARYLVDQVTELGGFEQQSWRDLDRVGRDRWMQVVLRLPDGSGPRG